MTQGRGCLPVWAPSAPCPSSSALYNVSLALCKHQLWLWELVMGVTLQISLLQNMTGALTINIYPGMEFQIPYNGTNRLMFPTLSCGCWDATATISSWHKPISPGYPAPQPLLFWLMWNDPRWKLPGSVTQQCWKHEDLKKHLQFMSAKSWCWLHWASKALYSPV